MNQTLIVIAKAPQAGRVKTRLCPPLRPLQAASLAEASLVDTLAAVLQTPGCRHALVLDGEPGPWLPAGLPVLAQRGADLADRLAAAFEDVGGPALLVGMDTPQLSPELLSSSLLTLTQSEAVLGRASDGGYWAIGLQRSDRRVFEGIAMSRRNTAALQLARLEELGLDCAELPELRDFDTFEDALEIVSDAPHGRFAARLAKLAA